MRSARLPFKQNDTDSEWGSVRAFKPDTFLDRLRLLFGRHQRGHHLFLEPIWYDPATVEKESDRAAGEKR